jgi:hypothetical protein
MENWEMNPLKVSYKLQGGPGHIAKPKKVDEGSSQANFWKIKAMSVLLPASILVTRTNILRSDTFRLIQRKTEWIRHLLRGFFDAEGRTPRGIGRKSAVPNVSVFNTNLELMSWVFGMLNQGLYIRTSRIYFTNYV